MPLGLRRIFDPNEPQQTGPEMSYRNHIDIKSSQLIWSRSAKSCTNQSSARGVQQERGGQKILVHYPLHLIELHGVVPAIIQASSAGRLMPGHATSSFPPFCR